MNAFMPPGGAALVPFSEDQLADQFARQHANGLLYDHNRGMWYRFDGSRWRPDETRYAFNLARELCRLQADAAENETVKRRLATAKTATSVELFAKADQRLAVGSNAWDQDPWLLACPRLTIDLRTGRRRTPSAEDRITRSTAVAPADNDDEGCPLWMAFLLEACGGDEEQVYFLQKLFGYSLTGRTSEHALFFIFGSGGNGKSVFLNVLTGILGGYAQTAPMDTFSQTGTTGHPTELAMLDGARLVTASETEEGRPWSEARIKQLTGGDEIAARFMRRDFFTFRPKFKLVIAGNHRPVLRNVDEAARRRFRMIPFTNRPKIKDQRLEDKLRAEWPAILSWGILGCIDWQVHGLQPPASIEQATGSYFDEQDLLQAFLDDTFEVDSRSVVPTGRVFQSWTQFALAAGEPVGTAKSLTQKLIAKSVEAGRATHEGKYQRIYKGLRYKVKGDGDA